MRICYLCADRGISLTKHNGAASHFRNLVRAFLALGHEVLALTPVPDGAEDLGVPVVPIPSPDILAPLLAGDGDDRLSTDKAELRVRRRLAYALGHVWNNVMVEQVLRDLLPRHRPDLLFEVYSPFGAAGGLMAKRLGVRHLLNVHAPLAREGTQYRQQPLPDAAEALERAAFAAARLIVTNSRELRAELLATGVPASKVEVVPNGVDVEIFSRAGRGHRQGLEGKFVMGFVGSLKPWHGVEVLITAFRSLAADPRLHLLVVGDGPMAGKLRALAEELPGRVTLTGPIPFAEVPPYIATMDVAVAPYPPLEGFYFSPLKVLEYLAAGRAVVASGIGQLNELIQDGVTGLLVPPGDAKALADAVRKLAADGGLREALGAAAAAEARRTHTWRQRASELIGLAQATA